jgi:hypothetical protein
MITVQATRIEEQRKASDKAASIKRAISAGAAGSPAAGDEPSVADMKSELEASVAWLSAKPQTAWR